MRYTVEFTDNINSKFGGLCTFPNLFMRLLGKPCEVKIRPKYKDDKGLLNHELKHVEQFYNDYLYGLKYNFSKAFRYKMELEAYTEQVKEYKYNDISQAKWIIDALFTKYNLYISEGVITNDVRLLIGKEY